MPAAIGLAILTAINVANPVLIGTVTLSEVVGTVVLTAGTFALSEALQPGAPKSSGEQQTTKQSRPPRLLAGGRVKSGGSLFFLDTWNVSLFQGIMHCEGPIDGIEEWWLNSTNSLILANTLGGPNYAAPWGGWVVIESHLGAVDQAVSPVLLQRFPKYWTTDHRLLGIAYSVVSHTLPHDPEKNFQKVFQSGAPFMRIVYRAALLFDPKKTNQSINNSATWTWSRNAGLLILWYLIHPRGINLPTQIINQASFAAFADLCDQPVAKADGGTVARYSLGFIIDETTAPRDNLRKMLDGCDARLIVTPDGTLAIQGGQWVEPSITIQPDWVLGYSYQQGNDVLSTFDRLKISYVEPLVDYQVIQGQDWIVNGSCGETSADKTFDYVQDYSQARRLAKIFTAKANPQHVMTVVVDKRGLLLKDNVYTVNLVLPELGVSESFCVTSLDPSGDLTTWTVGLVSLAASAYAWDAATEEGPQPVFQLPTPQRRLASTRSARPGRGACEDDCVGVYNHGARSSHGDGARRPQRTLLAA